MIGLPNPWLLLAAVIAIGAAGAGGYVVGDDNGFTRGSDMIQSRWNEERDQNRKEADQRKEEARIATKELQDAADAKRQEDADKIAELTARNGALLDELRQRPKRPAPGAATPTQVAGPGTDGRCTGAGLYQDDAVFLAGKAELWQRIRMQRDTCYANFETARQRLEALEAKQP